MPQQTARLFDNHRDRGNPMPRAIRDNVLDHVRPGWFSLGEKGSADVAAVDWMPASQLKPIQSEAIPITVAYGDGIGPEIMTATLDILSAAGAKLKPQVIEIGEKVYNRGFVSGIGPDGWQSLRDTKIFLKAPVSTPQGGGLKSVNVTVRKAFGLFANVRPCVAFAPFVSSQSEGMDIVVIRENEEDLYAGIEHRQTDDVYQCLKLISRSGSERVIRYAFEFAQANGRSKVTCLTKDNIMKMTDGLFHRVFKEIAEVYPHITSEHLIVDHGIAKLTTQAKHFDVIVAPNLYGDIVSDVAAQIAGSVGLAGSANIGPHGAMFEAVHGTAPTLAGLDVANPSGLIRASLMLLQHIGQNEVAERVQNAWLRTVEDGLHTADIFDVRFSSKCVGTREFSRAVIDRLNSTPRKLRALSPKLPIPTIRQDNSDRQVFNKEIVGVDVFIHWTGQSPQILADALQEMDGNGFVLTMISNRGVKVWPNGQAESFCTDHWRCRFMSSNSRDMVNHDQIADLLRNLAASDFDFIKIETLCTFNDEPGYSLGHGQ
jgi:isocitrate dehydrogenase